MYAARTKSRVCEEPLARRALAHLRAAAGLAKRNRGAQPGNRNRLTHGMYSGAFRARRQQTRTLLRQSYALVVLATRAARMKVRSSRRDTRIVSQCVEQLFLPWPANAGHPGDHWRDVSKKIATSLSTSGDASTGRPGFPGRDIQGKSNRNCISLSRVCSWGRSWATSE
jgi:hypothetical protein